MASTPVSDYLENDHELAAEKGSESAPARQTRVGALTRQPGRALTSVAASAICSVVLLAITGVPSTALLSSCSAKSTAPTADTAPKLVRFESRDGRFSIVFPTKPRETVKSGMRGERFVEMPMVVAEHGEMAYVIGWWDEERTMASFGGLDGFFDVAIKGSVETYNGTLVGPYKLIKLGDVPGAAFEADIVRPRPGRIWGRIYLAGTRAYTLGAVGNRTLSKDADKFFDSFRLLN